MADTKIDDTPYIEERKNPLIQAKANRPLSGKTLSLEPKPVPLLKKPNRPYRVRNLLDDTETSDTLHYQADVSL